MKHTHRYVAMIKGIEEMILTGDWLKAMYKVLLLLTALSIGCWKFKFNTLECSYYVVCSLYCEVCIVVASQYGIRFLGLGFDRLCGQIKFVALDTTKESDFLCYFQPMFIQAKINIFDWYSVQSDWKHILFYSFGVPKTYFSFIPRSQDLWKTTTRPCSVAVLLLAMPSAVSFP